jgi:hypothetical protein
MVFVWIGQSVLWLKLSLCVASLTSRRLGETLSKHFNVLPTVIGLLCITYTNFQSGQVTPISTRLKVFISVTIYFSGCNFKWFRSPYIIYNFSSECNFEWFRVLYLYQLLMPVDRDTDVVLVTFTEISR